MWPHPANRHDLQNCKQKDSESIHDYYKRFAEIFSTLVVVSDREMIDYFGDGLRDKFLYQNFGRHKTIVAEFLDMVDNWINSNGRV